MKRLALSLLTLLTATVCPQPQVGAAPIIAPIEFDKLKDYQDVANLQIDPKAYSLSATTPAGEDCYHDKAIAYLKQAGIDPANLKRLPAGFKSWKDYDAYLKIDAGACAAVSPPAAPPASLDWSPQNKAVLDKFFASGNLKGQVAVFDADDTLWRNDAGEGFLKYLIAHKKLVNLPAGFDPFANYEALCAQNKWMGYPYATQVMAGMKVSEIQALAKDFFKTFSQNIYPSQKALIQRLHAAGVDVWIVSASPQWLIEQGAPYLGVPANRVVGVRLAVANGLATPHIVPPMTFRQGKVEAIKQYIRKQPVYVSGDSITDFEMLQYASRQQMVINPKDKNAPEDNIFLQATKRNWPIQRW